MKVIYVDDERNAHINFYYDMKDRAEIASLECFFTFDQVMDYAKDNAIDCAFLDVELGGSQNGLALAEQLKALQPEIEVVFVTAYDEYARQAYRVGGRSYLSKPFVQPELDETMALLQKLIMARRKEQSSASVVGERVYIKTFGYFDLLVDGQPVAFKNAKAKELLAFLVDRRGGTVTGSQILMALWEHLEYSPVTSTYVRRTVRALKEELEALEIGAVFSCKRNCYSVDAAHFQCDYYRLMEGDTSVGQQYNEEYMSQYSWGESTIPLIERKINGN